MTEQTEHMSCACADERGLHCHACLDEGFDDPGGAAEETVRAAVDEVLVEGSWFPRADLPAVLGGYMRSDAQRSREAKEAYIRLLNQDAILQRVRQVHDQYFDPENQDYGVAIEPKDVWRFDRDFRAALNGPVMP